MPFTSLAGAANIVGNLASAFGGGSGDGIDVSENVRLTKWVGHQQTTNEIERLQRLKQAGIHPLFALGATQAAPSGIASIPGDNPNKLARVAEGIGNIARDRTDGQLQKQLEALGLRQAEASARHAEANAKIAELELSQAALARQAAVANSDLSASAEKAVPEWKPEPRPPSLPSPEGKKELKRGPGPSAQELEDEYGDIGPGAESLYRWGRDRGVPMLKDNMAPGVEARKRDVENALRWQAEQFLRFFSRFFK